MSGAFVYAESNRVLRHWPAAAAAAAAAGLIGCGPTRIPIYAIKTRMQDPDRQRFQSHGDSYRPRRAAHCGQFDHDRDSDSLPQRPPKHVLGRPPAPGRAGPGRHGVTVKATQ